MAILKIISNDYTTENMHFTLNDYAKKDKSFIGGYNLFLGTPETAVQYASEQMDSALCYYGKNYGQLLKHAVLSFDSSGSEAWVTPEIACRIAMQFCQYCLYNYQVFFGIHTDTASHLHIHFIINGVNLTTGYKFPDKKQTYQSMQKYLKKKTNLSECLLVYENVKNKLNIL